MSVQCYAQRCLFSRDNEPRIFQVDLTSRTFHSPGAQGHTVYCKTDGLREPFSNKHCELPLNGIYNLNVTSIGVICATDYTESRKHLGKSSVAEFAYVFQLAPNKNVFAILSFFVIDMDA